MTVPILQQRAYYNTEEHYASDVVRVSGRGRGNDSPVVGQFLLLDLKRGSCRDMEVMILEDHHDLKGEMHLCREHQTTSHPMIKRLWTSQLLHMMCC